MLPTAAAVTTRRRSFARRVGLVAVIVGHNHRSALAIAAIPAMLFVPSQCGADDASPRRCCRRTGHSVGPARPGPRRVRDGGEVDLRSLIRSPRRALLTHY